MKRIHATIAVAVILLLALSVSAHAVSVGDSWSYCLRAPGQSGVTAGVMNPWFTFVGAVGNSSAALATSLGVPANEFGLYISSNVPVVGVRSGTWSVGLPADGTYQVSVAWGATTSAKTNAKHVVTYDGGTSTVLLDQLAAGNKNVWKSLGTYHFLTGAGNEAKVKLTNDNQTTSGSLYLGAVKFEVVTLDPVPEPSSLLALGTGLIGMVGLIRRRRA